MNETEDESNDDPDLDRWLEALSGRGSTGAPDRNTGTASRLRAHILRQNIQIEQQASDSDFKAGKEKLLFASRRISSKKKGGVWSAGFNRPLQIAAGIAVLIGGTFVVDSVYRDMYAPGVLEYYGSIERMRGASDELSIRTSTPLSSGRRLANALSDAEIDFELTRLPEGILTIEITANGEIERSRLNEIFADWELVFSQDGYYYIEIIESGN